MASPTLDRRLGLGDAVMIGLGSMVGAGVFAAFAPASAAAGGALLVGLALAAFLAYCNAVASAQLAAAFPASGGTYVYGREMLGAWWGFAAGWCFMVGKTASCAAMALTAAAYAVPGSVPAQRAAAVAAVVALTAVNTRGITRTAFLTRVLVVLSLAVAVVAMWTTPEPVSLTMAGGTAAGVAESAGILFFAFAGYARLATMGEEVRDPARTIPLAIPIALGIAVAVYAVVGVALLRTLGPVRLGASHDPLARAVGVAGHPGLEPVVRAGAVVAALGALLALIAGLGRTGLAMARERDLPPWLAAVHPRFRVPHRAEIAVAAAVCALVTVVDLRGAIGFSSFGVLLYYAVANASAFRQAGSARRHPRWLNALAAVGCVAVAVLLPWRSVAAGVAVVALGLAWRLWRLRGRGPR